MKNSLSVYVHFREYRDPTRVKSRLMPQVPQHGDLIIDEGEAWVVECVEYEFAADKSGDVGIRACCRTHDLG